ncbi:MAG: DUF1801 domain-containing protein [Candidatus Bathyarchaeota archaeon]|nr:DUF1801 domain-containing protein [Candidatus Bathyarchaeota archaeon]
MPEATSPIDEYISRFTGETKERLQKIRKLIKKTAPNATEIISYGIPTYKQRENLVHFAGYKKHIGFYPTPSGIEAFQDELKEYKTSKGAIQFPHDKPIPYDLIKRIVQYRIQSVENE